MDSNDSQLTYVQVFSEHCPLQFEIHSFTKIHENLKFKPQRLNNDFTEGEKFNF